MSTSGEIDENGKRIHRDANRERTDAKVNKQIESVVILSRENERERERVS